MFIPFISPSRRDIDKRKGGGGAGRGSSSSSGTKGGSSSGKGSSSGGKSSSSGWGGSSGSSSGSSSSSSKPSKSSWSGWGSTSSSKKKSSTPRPYSAGGGAISSIAAGSLFAGRTVGGGTRSGVFGSRIYGSGYPGVIGRGVGGRGFPFFFWPLAWGTAGAGSAAYLYNDEYGLPNNSSRPGGAQMTAAFQSVSTSTIFRVVSDNDTIVELIDAVNGNCSSKLTTTATSSAPFDIGIVKPEQIVQYYRASSASLSIDGYNNTAVLSSTDNAPDSPLPSTVDLGTLECLNATIGNAIPLVDGAWEGNSPMNLNMGSLGLAWVVFWWIKSML